MNCVKCGALLEEGSTSTMCASCQALEATVPTGENTSEPSPVEEGASAPTEAPAENHMDTPTTPPVGPDPSGIESMPSTEGGDTPVEGPATPEDSSPSEGTPL